MKKSTRIWIAIGVSAAVGVTLLLLFAKRTPAEPIWVKEKKEEVDAMTLDEIIAMYKKNNVPIPKDASTKELKKQIVGAIILKSEKG